MATDPNRVYYVGAGCNPCHAPGAPLFLTRPCLRPAGAFDIHHDMLDGLRQGLVRLKLRSKTVCPRMAYTKRPTEARGVYTLFAALFSCGPTPGRPERCARTGRKRLDRRWQAGDSAPGRCRANRQPRGHFHHRGRRQDDLSVRRIGALTPRTVGFDAVAGVISAEAHRARHQRVRPVILSRREVSTTRRICGLAWRVRHRLRLAEIPGGLHARDRQVSDTVDVSVIWQEIQKAPVTIFTFSPGGDALVSIGWHVHTGRFYRLLECC